ncbi:TetR/AcrR family transcriptional regulator [Nocardioides marmoribigeumensis]|jgi:AcrR family transcriptional regulator|uniref:AcrR family transcriptional regulator n=1 Tax=Nocardioides marmoribigeumensis TaxID=433649 RepID=A0ABU2BVP2_9ACTN|nr:TetR/AcrR family transcriptional regulator [Nocardioides marmoribigeumensis]MDR7362709.1 AcrR family transcriptional regulator [Nocardioides marmoribigeumensis]
MTSSRHIDTPDPDTVVLDAARASILAVGFRRSTLTDIAKRAGISRMTIYRRWDDMQAVLADLLVREWDTALREALAATTTASPTPAALAGGVVETVRLLRADELFARIVEVDPELLLPYLLQRRGRNQDRIVEVLATAVRLGQSESLLREGDPVTIARSVVLAAQGYVLSLTTMTDPDVTEDALLGELAHLIEGHLQP